MDRGQQTALPSRSEPQPSHWMPALCKLVEVGKCLLRMEHGCSASGERWGMGLLCARLPCLLDEALDWNLSAVLGLQFSLAGHQAPQPSNFGSQLAIRSPGAGDRGSAGKNASCSLGGPSSAPSIGIRCLTNTCISGSKGSDAPFLPVWAPRHVHRYTLKWNKINLKKKRNPINQPLLTLHPLGSGSLEHPDCPNTSLFALQPSLHAGTQCESYG